MKLIIDEKCCLKHHLTPEELLVALSVRSINDLQKVFDNLVAREVLVYRDHQYYITPHWSDEVDAVISESTGSVDDEERLNSLAQKMRECFPKGRMPGTPYYYRCNAREIVLKLKKFIATYGNYSDDKILDATKRYIASFQGNYKYLPLIKYFIYKEKLVLGEDGTQHVSPESPLATYLENKEDNNLVTASDDWLTTVRN